MLVCVSGSLHTHVNKCAWSRDASWHLQACFFPTLPSIRRLSGNNSRWAHSSIDRNPLNTVESLWAAAWLCCLTGENTPAIKTHTHTVPFGMLLCTKRACPQHNFLESISGSKTTYGFAKTQRGRTLHSKLCDEPETRRDNVVFCLCRVMKCNNKTQWNNSWKWNAKKIHWYISGPT